MKKYNSGWSSSFTSRPDEHQVSRGATPKIDVIRPERVVQGKFKPTLDNAQEDKLVAHIIKKGQRFYDMARLADAVKGLQNDRNYW